MLNSKVYLYSSDFSAVERTSCDGLDFRRKYSTAVKIFRIRRNKYQPYLAGSLEKRGAELRKKRASTCRPKEAQSTTGLRRRWSNLFLVSSFGSLVQKRSPTTERNPGVRCARRSTDNRTKSTGASG